MNDSHQPTAARKAQTFMDTAGEAFDNIRVQLANTLHDSGFQLWDNLNAPTIGVNFFGQNGKEILKRPTLRDICRVSAIPLKPCTPILSYYFLSFGLFRRIFFS